MARRLWGFMVLISLVLLAQAPGSFATTYSITALGDVNNAYTWRHSYSDSGIPWLAGSEFSAGYPTYFPNLNESVWGIGYFGDDNKIHPFTNTNPGTANPDGSYTIVFDSTTANPNFFITLPDGKKIISVDTVITYIAKYNNSETNTYAVVEGKIIGTGTNSADHNPFYFEALLQEVMGNHQNVGYLSSFTMQYPYSPAAHTPIPGAVWLLGTGLLGLACAGWRQRS